MTLNVGLLLCDHVPEPLKARFNDYPNMLEIAFSKLGKEIIWNVFDACHGFLPTKTEALDGYIISGSKSSANDSADWIEKLSFLIQELREKNIPTVGLCFGHQLMSKVCGGVVDISKTGWGVGCKKFRLTDSRSWMAGTLETLIVPAFHQEQIVSLPENSMVLGHTNYCENFFIQFDARMLGIQGHPEFETEYVSALLDERLAVLSPETILEAERSLALTTDSVLIRQWIYEFLTKESS